MKALVLWVAIAGIFTACKPETLTSEQLEAAEITGTSTISEVAKEGFGKVELQCGSQTVNVEGKCGGVTNTGDMIIAVQDMKVPSKVFTISFNGVGYPENGKVYTVKKSDFMSEGKQPANEIYIGFSEMTQASQMNWSSDDESGTMIFQTNGNEIKCKFNGIKLQPSAVYNKGDLNNMGTASGEITLYKN